MAAIKSRLTRTLAKGSLLLKGFYLKLELRILKVEEQASSLADQGFFGELMLQESELSKTRSDLTNISKIILELKDKIDELKDQCVNDNSKLDILANLVNNALQQATNENKNNFTLLALGSGNTVIEDLINELMKESNKALLNTIIDSIPGKRLDQIKRERITDVNVFNDFLSISGLTTREVVSYMVVLNAFQNACSNQNNATKFKEISLGTFLKILEEGRKINFNLVDIAGYISEISRILTISEIGGPTEENRANFGKLVEKLEPTYFEETSIIRENVSISDFRNSNIPSGNADTSEINENFYLKFNGTENWFFTEVAKAILKELFIINKNYDLDKNFSSKMIDQMINNAKNFEEDLEF
jgi:hypothetical protein